MPELNSSRCFKRYLGTGPIAGGGGWRVGLSWDGCAGSWNTREEGEELKKGGKVLDFCDAPGPASPAAFLRTTVAFWGTKRMRGATARRTLLEVGPLCIRKALSVDGHTCP